MRKIGLIFICIICFIVLYQSMDLWQKSLIQSSKNVHLQEEIAALHQESVYLNALPEAPIGILEANYEELNEQLRLLTRTYNFKYSLLIDKLKSNELLFNVADSSRWLGIKQMSTRVRFYDLGDTAQYIRILKYFEILEEIYPIEILNIVKSINHLEIGFQLYGR